MPNTPTHRFVVLCRARTGSNLLVDLLNKFSDINCYGEVFKTHRLDLPDAVKKKLGATKKNRDQFPISFLNNLYDLDQSKITGLKLFFSHNIIARHFLAETKNVSKILLTRSPIDSYVSFLVANSTKKWVKSAPRRNWLFKLNKARDRDEEKSQEVMFDAMKFEEYLKSGTEFERWCEDVEKYTGQSFYRIDYAEVAAIEPVRQLAKFLGTKDISAKLVPKLEKQIKKPLHEIVTNYDEMEKHLRSRGMLS